MVWHKSNRTTTSFLPVNLTDMGIYLNMIPTKNESVPIRNISGLFIELSNIQWFLWKIGYNMIGVMEREYGILDDEVFG